MIELCLIAACCSSSINRTGASRIHLVLPNFTSLPGRLCPPRRVIILLRKDLILRGRARPEGGDPSFLSRLDRNRRPVYTVIHAKSRSQRPRIFDVIRFPAITSALYTRRRSYSPFEDDQRFDVRQRLAAAEFARYRRK